jgi:hypothetical protein
MMYLVLISLTAACKLPHLPPLIDYFSPSYSSKGLLEGSGRFLSSDVTWKLEVKRLSWIRIVSEPKGHIVEVEIRTYSNTYLYAKAPHLGVAHLAGKLEPGAYEVKIKVKEMSVSDDNNIIDCSLPNMHLNIGLNVYEDLLKFPYQNSSELFPDISEIEYAINDIYSYSNTFESCSISSDKIFDGFLKSYSIVIPKTKTELSPLGFAGLWELTFSLRNY